MAARRAFSHFLPTSERRASALNAERRLRLRKQARSTRADASASALSSPQPPRGSFSPPGDLEFLPGHFYT